MYDIIIYKRCGGDKRTSLTYWAWHRLQTDFRFLAHIVTLLYLKLLNTYRLELSYSNSCLQNKGSYFTCFLVFLDILFIYFRSRFNFYFKFFYRIIYFHFSWRFCLSQRRKGSGKMSARCLKFVHTSIIYR